VLERVLKRDVNLAREALRDIVGQIVLRPTTAGLVAEFRGNLRGLLALGEPAPVLETVVAGARNARKEHLEPVEFAVG
jgi:hypothetical protein